MEPGTEIVFERSGEGVRLCRRKGGEGAGDSSGERLAAFDAATERQERRDREFRDTRGGKANRSGREWTRDDLYAGRLPG